MLVLNTNEQNKGNRVSNQMLWQYPDFRQILMKPIVNEDNEIIKSGNWNQFSNIAITPETYWKTVKSVNWTAINFWCAKLFEDKIYQNMGWMSYIKLCRWMLIVYWTQTNGWNTNFTNSRMSSAKLRIGLNDNPFLGWEIIGKKVIFNPILYVQKLISWTNYVSISDIVEKISIQYSCSLEIGLLKKDWTIKKIGTLSFYDEKLEIADLVTNKNVSKQLFFDEQFEGVIAENGDIIIADFLFDFKFSYSWNKSRSEYKTIDIMTALWFWENWSSNTQLLNNTSEPYKSSISPLPIQISIE